MVIFLVILTLVFDYIFAISCCAYSSLMSRTGYYYDIITES